MSSSTVADLKKKRIAVLMGGLSEERDVSLRSGAAVAGALESRGYTVVRIDVGRDVAARLSAERIDVAFIALHGRYGEDGSIQGLLESMFIPYTGSGVLSSSVGMEKVFSKQVFVSSGIPTPAYRVFYDAAEAEKAELPFGLPCVVKPSREGSSVGVALCKTREEYVAAVRACTKYAGAILVEAYHKGQEVQGAVLDNQALGLIEVIPAREFYDYTAKYGPGSGTRYVYPAPLEPKLYAAVNDVCLRAHRALGCEGASRTDAIVMPSGEIYVLEVNTLPGMTETSLLPKIAAGCGIDFPTLCERILAGARLKA